MEETYDHLINELKNQLNWLKDTEQTLAVQESASEDQGVVSGQLEEHKVNTRSTLSIRKTLYLIYILLTLSIIHEI